MTEHNVNYSIGLVISVCAQSQCCGL